VPPLPLLLALHSARLEAAIDDRRDVAVRFTYGVESSGARRVGFSALEIGGVAIEEVAAFASGAPLPLGLEPRSGPKRRGWIDLPGGAAAFEFRYVVQGGAQPAGDGLGVRLPAIVLDLKLEETKAGLFSSRVEIPAGLSVVDGFPSHPLVETEGVYRWELPLVPAFVAFRASSQPALLTPPRVATAAVVLLLLAMGFLAVHKARSHRP
jgi:hypothetical protein